MDELTIRVFVEGVRRWCGEEQWPLARTRWTQYVLRPRRQLSTGSEPLTDAQAQLLPPASSHLPSGRATTHKIYRDAAHRPHLLMPVIPEQ